MDEVLYYSDGTPLALDSDSDSDAEEEEGEGNDNGYDSEDGTSEGNRSGGVQGS